MTPTPRTQATQAPTRESTGSSETDYGSPLTIQNFRVSHEYAPSHSERSTTSSHGERFISRGKSLTSHSGSSTNHGERPTSHGKISTSSHSGSSAASSHYGGSSRAISTSSHSGSSAASSHYRGRSSRPTTISHGEHSAGHGERSMACCWHILEHLKRFENLLMIVVVGSLLSIQFSTPFIAPLSLVRLSVTDGKVNGTLRLGTYGYCLYLPNKDCSGAHFLYKISQFFFFQPSHFITSSYLLIVISKKITPKFSPKSARKPGFFP